MIEVQVALANAIRETRALSQQVNQAQKRLIHLEGQQEALSKLFLNGAEMTLQEAFDQNYNGLKDEVDTPKEP